MFVDTSKMINIEEIRNNTEKKLNSFSLAMIAKEYIESQSWCKSIRNGYLAEVFEGILGVFYFELEVRQEADEKLWVLCGDIPSAYLVTDNSSNAFEALNNYVGEMYLWVEAVKMNKSVEGLIPVNAKPEEKNAKMLEKRLKFIDQEILTLLSKDQ